jgi:glycerol kinase
MQFQSDVLGIALHRGAHTEMTALGAAMIARVGLEGKLVTRASRGSLRGLENVFYPTMKRVVANEIVSYWDRATSFVDTFSRR